MIDMLKKVNKNGTAFVFVFTTSNLKEVGMTELQSVAVYTLNVQTFFE